MLKLLKVDKRSLVLKLKVNNKRLVLKLKVNNKRLVHITLVGTRSNLFPELPERRIPC